jgi:hypothetical protein
MSISRGHLAGFGYYPSGDIERQQKAVWGLWGGWARAHLFESVTLYLIDKARGLSLADKTRSASLIDNTRTIDL